MTPDQQVQVQESIDHLFRHHAGQMVSVLCRIFGFGRIDMVEDAVQDSLIAAMRTWPFNGVPENPTAWLIQTAKNRLIDRLRRDGRSDSADDEFDVATSASEKPVYFPDEIAEDQLRMIFACCHPSIPPDSQVALTLKIVGGFSVPEIASAYLASEEAVAKMLTRAKARLRGSGIVLDIPVADEITSRLDAVLKVLYLMFNEGYGASGGDELVRRDLCFEAIRLVDILAKHPMTASPKVHAVAALFMFQASRLPARTDHAGELVLLSDQDRSLWDRDLIGRAIRHMRLSADGIEISTFHLEAEIAAAHTLSPDYASTDWRRILECYTSLQQHHFSKIAELNRIVVLSQIDGPEAALAALEDLARLDGLKSHNLFHITRGQLLADLDRSDEAKVAFMRALDLTRNTAVRRFVESRLEKL
jgi:RNA polymerase sigma factor (sigma-70 family)